MYILVVLYTGEIEFIQLCANENVARVTLVDWCCDNWHDDDIAPDEFANDEDTIQWYFERYEDYSHYMQLIQIPYIGEAPVPPQGEDVFLTPGMCAIVRKAVGKVNYGRAHEILLAHDEIEPNEDEQALKAIDAILKQFK